jgi:hypothetical protein
MKPPHSQLEPPTAQESPKTEYYSIQAQLSLLRDQITLKRWKLLSRAYKLGKKVWGRGFDVKQLAEDMEIPLTTCKRCLALDRANPRNLQLMAEGKISAFKVAMICQLKNYVFQDEIVDLVIKDNLSTYKIKTLKINNLSDINKFRHQQAVERGYSRKDSAFSNMDRWIERGFQFLALLPSSFTHSKISSLISRLKLLDDKIRKKIVLYESYKSSTEQQRK